MSESPDPKTQAPALRGDAAWKAARDGVEARNAAARKVGMAQRAAHEREKEAHRRKIEDQETARFIAGRKD